MTNWQMEVGRMTLYILFPIGVYYYFNQSDSLDEWIKEEKKKFAPVSGKQREEFAQFIEEFNNKQRMRQLVEMEAKYQETKMK
ncbi:protein PET100 homolog, mitochondrial-like [Xylocopa sonorina]|uniref:protein PET100 homolog, mitochondrial-like n=1 Tax=Xylocopa sonorina TaxID=1818115 RepID=UPI00403B2C59